MAGIAGATVTVIFADVEGSTALLERLGQARWMTALAEYEELLGSRLDAHGGTLVKALGDGHLLAFPSANAALRCAVDVQRALPLTTAPDLRAENAALPIMAASLLEMGPFLSHACRH